jgi:dihydrofolate synthase/folylpolyglutamate synthase
MPDALSKAEQYLRERARLGMKLGLEAMRALCAELGDPQRAAPALLVAGTNGKGSVVAYADAVLRACGLRVGRYTSPHLVRVHERITVEGADIGDRDFEEVVGAVRDAAQVLVERGVLADHPTYFETLTAAAFLHFRAQAVQVAVLEVGLGGRLDATNVSEPAVSAIVTVDRDHEDHLGTTLADIAREKAGVLRPGRVTVLGALSAEARAAVEAQARAVGARLLDAGQGASMSPRGDDLAVRTPRRSYDGLRALPGLHQRDNLLVALRLLEAAEDEGVVAALDPAAVARGLASVRWPARLQEVPGRPALLLDGAHNPAGARALARHLRGREPAVLLFGAMSDKDLAGLATALFPVAREIVLTRAPDERGAEPDQIAARAGPLATRAHRERDPGRALQLARILAGPAGTVVVAGSLYLVGDVLRRLEASRPGSGG